MKRIFLDTNIVIDFFDTNRVGNNLATQLLTLAENKRVEIIISSLSYLNAYYILTNRLKKSNNLVIGFFIKLRTITNVSDISKSTLDKALVLGWKDFEVATQYLSAKESNCDAIITSDRKGFSGSDIPVYSASEYLKMSNQ